MTPIYHNLSKIEGMPDASTFAQWGIKEQAIAYENDLFAPGADRHRDQVDAARLLAAAKKAHDNNQHLVLDVETRPVYKGTDKEIETNLDLQIEMVDMVREAYPGLAIGMYGEFPIRDYWACVPYKQAADPTEAQVERYRDWKARNHRIRLNRDDRGRMHRRALPDVLDFLCPSFYTLYNDLEGWKVNTLAMLDVAYKAHTRVNGYLWPLMHHGGNTDNIPMAFLEQQFFLEQLRFLAPRVDAITIWGWGGTKSGDPNFWEGNPMAVWDNNFPFMKALWQFQQERGVL